MATADRATPNPTAQVTDELQELADTDLEELEPTLQMAVPAGAADRVSAAPSSPPPLPIEARRSSVPPSPPQSGMFRISERPSAAPPDMGALTQQAQRLQAELHERTTQVDRMRLALTLRDDRVHELQRVLARQRERTEELERALEAERERVRSLESRLQRTETLVADDLKRIQGIGPVFARKMAERGITRFEQLASFGPQQVCELAEALGIPVRRIESGGWVAKAAELAAELNAELATK